MKKILKSEHFHYLPFYLFSSRNSGGSEAELAAVPCLWPSKTTQKEKREKVKEKSEEKERERNILIK